MGKKKKIAHLRFVHNITIKIIEPITYPNVHNALNGHKASTTRNQAFSSDFKIVTKKFAANKGYLRRFSSRRLIFVAKLGNH